MGRGDQSGAVRKDLKVCSTCREGARVAEGAARTRVEDSAPGVRQRRTGAR